jgi:hypothetical protein
MMVLIKTERIPTSKVINNESNRYKPNGRINIRILLPNGILYTTSNISNTIAQIGRKKTQSIFLNKK